MTRTQVPLQDPPKSSRRRDKFASALFRTGVTKTDALEALVIAGFVRGLSVRDVEGGWMTSSWTICS
jgi:hypothetical protein